MLKFLATWCGRRLCFGDLLTDVYEGLLKEAGGGIPVDLISPQRRALVRRPSEPPMFRDPCGPWSAAGVSASGSGELRRSRLFHGGFSLAVFPLMFDEVAAGAEGFCLSHVFAAAAPARTPLHKSAANRQKRKSG